MSVAHIDKQKTLLWEKGVQSRVVDCFFFLYLISHSCFLSPFFSLLFLHSHITHLRSFVLVFKQHAFDSFYRQMNSLRRILINYNMRALIFPLNFSYSLSFHLFSLNSVVCVRLEWTMACVYVWLWVLRYGWLKKKVEWCGRNDKKKDRGKWRILYIFNCMQVERRMLLENCNNSFMDLKIFGDFECLWRALVLSNAFLNENWNCT